VKIWSHLVVLLSILVVGALALTGFIGENAQDEKIEQLQVVLTAEGDSGLRVTEVIDQDFGTASKHGPQLVVPNDFGAVTDVTASAADEDTPDDVQVDQAPFGSPVEGTRIRVGDPDITITGQHRYTISYVLPTARFAAPTFALDAVGADSEIPIEDVTVVFNGISLEDPTCVVGSAGSEDPCEFERGAPLRLAYDRLDPKQGITVGGEVTEWAAADGEIAAPPLPEQRTSNRGFTALWTMALGAIAALAVYVTSVRSGSNEVVGAGAAEAAHGVAGPGPGTTRKVTDAELAEMTTIEFAPPKGIEPWQGAVAYSEVLDQSSVTAWFSGAIANDHLAIEQHDGKPRLSRGPKASEIDPVSAKVLDKMFGNREVVDLDGYDAKFASAWTKVEELQDEWVANSGWWAVRPPRRGQGKPGGCATLFTLVFFAIVLGVAAAFLLGVFGVIGGVVTGVLVGLGLPFITARVAYSPLRASRTANGSAYALQVASFRRFLVESEGQHVEWAWKNGLLRQYSAWAVALDAADAWQAAMERAGVPRAEFEAGSPLMVHSMAGAFAASHVQPTQSSSGSGSSGFSSGGFSGGSVGGGGGGGSHGSW
jgi:uncharacterized membrane protein YgcG